MILLLIISYQPACFVLRTLTVLKVEAVEVHALYQVAQSLWLKRGQTRITDLPAEREEHTSPQ